MRNVPTELILLEIAEGLQNLAKNPDLSNKIKETYALSEAEQKKAEEAKALISKADSIRAELKKREDALADVDQRIKRAEAVEAFNEDSLNLINAKNGELDQREKAVKAAEKMLEDDAIELTKKEKAVSDREVSVKIAEGEIAAERADLKTRIAKMKALV